MCLFVFVCLFSFVHVFLESKLLYWQLAAFTVVLVAACIDDSKREYSISST